MTECFFVSDLHGKPDRYHKLFNSIAKDLPDVVFFGGDLLPHFMKPLQEGRDFIEGFFYPQMQELRKHLKDKYPCIYLILGNDDSRVEEKYFLQGEEEGFFHYINQRKMAYKQYTIYGYSFVPPTPFRLKDWEKYDVSRYVDPGCIPPTEGFRTAELTENIEFATIEKDLESLTKGDDLDKAVFLFHSPPYDTWLDRAALDNKMIEHVPLDVHVGSIAIKRLIETRRPWLTLHGHIHESSRLTGHWMQKINNTVSFNAAHDGPELSLIRFDLEDPGNARRDLI